MAGYRGSRRSGGDEPEGTVEELLDRIGRTWGLGVVSEPFLGEPYVVLWHLCAMSQGLETARRRTLRQVGARLIIVNLPRAQAGAEEILAVSRGSPVYMADVALALPPRPAPPGPPVGMALLMSTSNDNSERIPTHSGKVPFLTTSEMVEVDRAMIEDFHIELVQMMENAGRNLAHLARVRFLDGEPEGKRVVVLAGTGGNGGGALVCARRLHNWGSDVRVMTATAAEALTPVPAHQLDILRRMGLPIAGAAGAGAAGAAGAEGLGELSTDGPFDLIIDGLIGYSLSGAPRGAAAELIRWANRVDAPVLALDTPSGLDTTTGTVYDPAVQATATMTLALPKEGLRAPGAESFVGELYLADISVPPQLYAEPGLGLRVGPIFARSEIVRLER